MDPETGELSEDPNGGAKIVGFSREGVARVSKHDNLELQVRTAERLADRFYGKPRTAVDLAGDGSGSIQISIPHDKDRHITVARVLVETGAIPADLFRGQHQEVIEASSVEVEDD